MKKAILLACFIATVAIVSACSSGASSSAGVASNSSSSTSQPIVETTSVSTTESISQSSSATGAVFTLEELAQYNGKNGNPAYVAIDGVVYDVSNVPQWKDGEHNGMQAGNDLTEQINTLSPHGIKVLTKLPVVGTLES